MSEQVSALIDGEVEESQLTKSILATLSNKNAMQASRDYQMIGDAMRGSKVPSEGLTQSIMDAIELEPTILSPNAIVQLNDQQDQTAKSSNVTTLNTDKRLSSAWSIAASVAAVMVVGVFVFNQQTVDPSGITGLTLAASDYEAATSDLAEPQQLANVVVPQEVVPAAPPSIPVEYLKAHRASAPSVGSHYIQAVNFSE